MKMTSKNWLVAVGVVVAGTAFAGFKIDDFEAYTNATPLVAGTNGWNASDPTVVVQTNMAHFGKQAAVVPVSANLSNLVNVLPGVSTNVWSDFWTIPRLYVSDTSTGIAGPAPDPNATAQFFLTSNGVWATICRTNGGSSGIGTNYWIQDIYNTSITNYPEGSNWIHVSVLHNYARKDWSLFINGAPVATNQSFINQTVPSYNWFNMQNGGGQSAWIDDVTITNRVPAGLQLDRDHNGMVDAWEMQYFGSLGTTNKASDDPDGDGLSNGEESYLGTDPFDPNDPGKVPMTASLPWSDYFDAGNRLNQSLYGQKGWSATNATVVAGGFANQSVQLNNGYASHVFGPNPAYTSVWTHLVLKPSQQAGTTKGTEVSSAAAQYYVTNNVVMALSGATWVALTNTIMPDGTKVGSFSVPNGDWVRFVSKSDYGSQTWALYAADVNGNAATKYARLIGQNLAFASGTSPNYYQGLLITNLDSSSVGYLDNVEITVALSPWIDTDGDGVPDYFAQQISAAAVTNGSSVPGVNVTNFAFGVTNAQFLSASLTTNVNPDIVMSFVVGSQRLYRVVGDSAAGGNFSTLVGTLDTGWHGTNNTFTVAHALTLSPTNRYFFRLAADSPDGAVSVTNPVTYAWFSQSRNSGAGVTNYYWVTSPIDYGTNNTLRIYSGSLGEALARGLVGNLTDAQADSIQLMTNGVSTTCYLDPDKLHWRGPATNNPIPAGTGFLVTHRGVPTAIPTTVYCGQVQTNPIPVALAAGWNIVGWPYSSETHNWAFMNAHSSTIASNADRIFLLNGLLYTAATYGTNGVWTIGQGVSGKGANATNFITVQPGQGFLYQRTGGSNTWSMTPQ